MSAPAPAPGGLGLGVKRWLDVSGALVLLALFGPLLIALALAVRWQLGSPALFRQVRVVGAGRQAQVVKLRTLPGLSDPDRCWVAPAEQATRLGRLLRASHLDELPQLVNVLRGEMSLVGPRPERPHFARRFAQEVPGYRDRTRMKAGLTGWAQVNGLNGDTSIAARAAFDNAYIDNWSLRLDLAILTRTAAAAAGDAWRGLRSGSVAGPVSGLAGGPAPGGPAPAFGSGLAAAPVPVPSRGGGL